ncbi:Ubiquitin carboxyl-terminal hydrolase [Abortiporus biennis]
MLVSSYLPSPSFSEDRDTTQYRPAKDLEAFNQLLPPPIEFIEGSSSGTLVIEGKYQPINGPSKPSSKSETHEPKRPSTSAASEPVPPTTPKPSHAATPKSLYPGTIASTWPDTVDMGCGLMNTGNTCFLNSALQVLIHTPPLIRVISAHRKEQCNVKKGSFCMICSLRSLMADCYKRNQPTTPYQITSNLNAIAKHLRRGRQEDSHEFLRYAIDALQKSCLAGYSPKIDHKLAETTWVHKIFGGRLRSRIHCLSCGADSDTFESMLDLSVDIFGIHSLKEALRKFVAIDHLKGSNKYQCEKCKRAVPAEKQFTVYDAPMVLSIHLKRFSPMGRKIGHPVRYEEHLSLQSVMSEGQHGPTYSLYAVISHAGGGPNSGHYYAHVKSGSGQWYEMNDEMVTRQSSPPVGLKNAYLLFYIRDKGQALQSALAPSAPIIPPMAMKGGIVANMRKRKSPEGDDSTKRPANGSSKFISPVMPSHIASSKDTPSKKQKPNPPDPQADLLKKKIAKVAKSPVSSALLSLSQYHDDDSSDVGEKVTDENEKSVEREEANTATAASLPPIPPTEPLAPPTPKDASITPAVKPIPASSFYGASAGKAKDGERSHKKRKSPDVDTNIDEWARTPISPSPSASKKKHPGRYSAANPFGRITGSDNLHQRRDDGSSVVRRHGNKTKFLM